MPSRYRLEAWQRTRSSSQGACGQGQGALERDPRGGRGHPLVMNPLCPPSQLSRLPTARSGTGTSICQPFRQAAEILLADTVLLAWLGTDEANQMSSDKDILGVSTSLLTVLALAATSKLWVLGLPILLVVDAVEELRSQGSSLLAFCSKLAHASHLKTFWKPHRQSSAHQEISRIGSRCHFSIRRFCLKGAGQKRHADAYAAIVK